jgi:hypothetical protein
MAQAVSRRSLTAKARFHLWPIHVLMEGSAVARMFASERGSVQETRRREEVMYDRGSTFVMLHCISPHRTAVYCTDRILRSVA